MRKPFANSPFGPWITQQLIESMIDLDWPTTGQLRMASELSREQVEWIMDNAADVSHGYLKSEIETAVDCRPGQDVPVIIEGREVDRIAMADVLP